VRQRDADPHPGAGVRDADYLAAQPVPLIYGYQAEAAGRRGELFAGHGTLQAVGASVWSSGSSVSCVGAPAVGTGRRGAVGRRRVAGELAVAAVKVSRLGGTRRDGAAGSP